MERVAGFSGLRILVSMQEESPDPLTEIRVALAGSDYKMALELLDELVEDPDYRDAALARLGWMYEIGMGVDVDLDQAAAYFAEAAELGNPEAMYAIAVMYLTGAGRPQDTAAGARWLRSSAALGYPRAVDKLDEIEAEESWRPGPQQ